MNRRASAEEIQFGSDSFLDVLANMVGILIILLVISGGGVFRAPKPDSAPAPEPEPSPAPVSEVEPAPVLAQAPGPSDDELADRAARRRARQAEWNQQLLSAQAERDSRRRELEQQQLALAEADARLKQKLAGRTQLENDAALVAAEKAKLGEAERKLRDQESQLARRAALTQRNIDELKKKRAGVANKYSLIPYDGASGTARRPIYIECTEHGYRILPEGEFLGPSDLEDFTEGYNPLRAGTEALVRYWNEKRQRSDKEEPEPYVLLLVRPSGTMSYYLARSMLSRLKTPFGYELIEDDLPLTFPDADPGAKAALHEALVAIAAQKEEVKDSVTPRELARISGDDLDMPDVRRAAEGPGGRGGNHGLTPVQNSGIQVRRAGTDNASGEPPTDLASALRAGGSGSGGLGNVRGGRAVTWPKGNGGGNGTRLGMGAGKGGTGGDSIGNGAQGGNESGDAAAGTGNGGKRGQAGDAGGKAVALAGGQSPSDSPGRAGTGQGNQTGYGPRGGAARLDGTGGGANPGPKGTLGGARGAGTSDGTQPGGGAPAGASRSGQPAGIGLGGNSSRTRRGRSRGQSGGAAPGEDDGGPGAGGDDAGGFAEGTGTQPNGKRRGGMQGSDGERGSGGGDPPQYASLGLGSNSDAPGEGDSDGWERSGQRTARQRGGSNMPPEGAPGSDGANTRFGHMASGSRIRGPVAGSLDDEGSPQLARIPANGSRRGLNAMPSPDGDDSAADGQGGDDEDPADGATPGASGSAGKPGGKTGGKQSGQSGGKGGQTGSGSQSGQPPGQSSGQKSGAPQGQSGSAMGGQAGSLAPPTGGMPQLRLGSPPQQGSRKRDASENDNGPKNVRWGMSNPNATIGREHKLELNIYARQVLIGPNDSDLVVPVKDGEKPDPLVEKVLSGIDRASIDWGSPGDNFYWVPRIKFVVHPGGNQNYERLRGPLRDWGLQSSTSYALDASPHKKTTSKPLKKVLK